MPYLICDPIPQNEADHFLVDIDGTIIAVDAERDNDAGTCHLHYDVSGVSPGSHTAKIAAVNMWGDGAYSDPFDFTKELPGQVSGVGLEV